MGAGQSSPGASQAARIARHGTRVLSSQAAVALLSVGFTGVLARLLSKTEFATFGVYTILCAATDVLAGLGLESTALQLVPSRGAAHAESRALMRTVLGSRVMLSALLAAGILAGSRSLSLWLMKSAAYAPAIRCMALGVFACSIFQSLQLLGQAAQEFGLISAWNTAAAALQRVLAIGLFFCLGVKGYLYGLAAGQLLGAAGLAWSLRRYFLGPGASWAALVRQSYPFCLRGFGRFGFLQADQALVALALNPEVFATYSLCRQLASYLRSAMEAFLGPALVKAAELRHAEEERLQRVFRKVSRYTLLGAAPLCCAAALASRALLSLFAGGKYEEGWPILAALCAAQLLYACGSLYGIFLFAAGTPQQVLRLDFAAGVASLLLSGTAIAAAGAMGAALAQLFSFALFIVIARQLTARVVPCRFDADVVRTLAPPLLAGGVLVALLQACWYTRLLLPLYLAGGGAIFLLLLVPRLTAEDWATLAQVSPRLRQAFPGRS